MAIKDMEIIRKILKSIDRKGYGAYQDLIGVYEFKEFKLLIDQIPKDPYAPAHTGVYRIQVSHNYVSIPDRLKKSKISEIAFCDFLARRFFDTSQKISKKMRGTGQSGIITIETPQQAILQRNSAVLFKKHLEIRFFMGLPAKGRTIDAKTAITMFFKELPQIVELALYHKNIDKPQLLNHIKTAEDADFLRKSLERMDLIAFVADGANLPRKSGISDEPLNFKSVIPFHSPDTLAVEIKLPNAGKIRGMGIPKGITLIVGGGFHGKSTLLDAISFGVYNHKPRDGRERCVSNFNAVKIRACSGRFVEKVDISTFIKNLPAQKDTKKFSTTNASGSTSQAASILEAIEIGAEVLLMDEDTCATNFMIRDRKMQKLVQKDDEPITTFIDKAKQFFEEKGISTILVLGGVGDYFDIATTVIQMNRYKAIDVTNKAKDIANQFPSNRIIEDEAYPITPIERIPLKSIDPYSDYNKIRAYATELNKINFGKTIIDLADIEQLIELSQTKAIIQAILYIRKYIDGKKTMSEIIDKFMLELETDNLDILSNKLSGHFAEFRKFELAFALNRLKCIKMK